MDKPADHRRIPWGLIWSSVLVALPAVIVHGLVPGDTAATPQRPLGMALVALLAFWSLRLLGRPLLGFLLAGLLIAHPLSFPGSGQSPEFLPAAALPLAALACGLLVWRQVLQPRFGFFAWTGSVLLLAMLTALAWVATRQPGWQIVLATVLLGPPVWWLAAFLGVLRRQRTDVSPGPPAVNIVLAVVLGIVVAVLGLAAAWGLSEAVRWSAAQGLTDVRTALPLLLPAELNVTDLLQQPFRPTPVPADTFAFLSAPAMDEWAWPYRWVVLALALLGLWRAFWRGWTERSAGRPPLAWVLLLFTAAGVLATVLHPESLNDRLPLATLTLLLAVFGLGDFFRSLGDKMVLAPPTREE